MVTFVLTVSIFACVLGMCKMLAVFPFGHPPPHNLGMLPPGGSDISVLAT